MQKQKKTEIITFRTDIETKEMLGIIAEQNKWTISQVVEQLIKNFIINPKPGEITIKTDEIKRIYDELVQDDKPFATLKIDLISENEGEPDESVYKGIEIFGIGHYGVGTSLGYDPIKEFEL